MFVGEPPSSHRLGDVSRMSRGSMHDLEMSSGKRRTLSQESLFRTLR